MNRDEAFTFLLGHPVFYLSTVEGKVPHVRSMALYRVDENGLVFHTDKSRPLCEQLAANPNVELCFGGAMGDFEVRVSGSAERVEDEGLKKQIDPNRADRLAVYRVKNATATVWTRITAARTSTTVDL